MKKFLLTLITFVFILATVKSQTVLFQDDFESYSAGNFLVQQAGSPWATWSNQPGGAEDALISTAQAHSPTKSVHLNNSADDIILKLGNKTSGKYAIEFNYFIPTGSGAYFNLQHFEAPGVEWAIEVFFGNNGIGQTTVNNVQVDFSHTINAWMKIETVVDLDSAWLFIDNVQVRDWKFSLQASSATGTSQLGAVNFYCAALSGTPQFYFDDVKFTQLQIGTNPPEIQLSTTQIATDGSANEVFTISKLGDQQMSFVAYPIYPDGSKKMGTIEHVVLPVGEKLMIGQPLKAPATINSFKSDRVNELSYVTSPLSSGMGYGGTVTVRSAVRFDYNFVSPFIGMELSSLTIGAWDMPAGTTKIQVYERGSYTTPGPGNLVAEKVFAVPAAMTEITVPLDYPVYLDGKDIWIGWVCDAPGGTFPIGIDQGPKVAGVNWLSTGPGWSEMGANIDNNLCITGTLQGTPVSKWLNVSPQMGVVNGGAQQTITASFNTTGMASGNYLAQIVIGCNDQTQEYSEVEVNLTIGASLNENAEKVAVMTYPNPVTDILNINTNSVIESVEIYSLSGQAVHTYRPQARDFALPVEGMAKGIYIIVIKTIYEQFERKIVVE